MIKLCLRCELFSTALLFVGFNFSVDCRSFIQAKRENFSSIDSQICRIEPRLRPCRLFFFPLCLHQFPPLTWSDFASRKRQTNAPVETIKPGTFGETDCFLIQTGNPCLIAQSRSIDAKKKGTTHPLNLEVTFYCPAADAGW